MVNEIINENFEKKKKNERTTNQIRNDMKNGIRTSQQQKNYK